MMFREGVARSQLLTFPVFETEMLRILQGLPLMSMYPPFLSSPAEMGVARAAPASEFSMV